MAAVTICSDFGAQENKVSHCFHCFPTYLQWSDGSDAMILVFWMLSSKPTFSLSSFTFIKRLFSSSSLSAITVVSSTYLSYWYFSWQSWFQLVLHPAFLMMYSTYKLNKQGDNIQPCCTPFPREAPCREATAWPGMTGELDHRGPRHGGQSAARLARSFLGWPWPNYKRRLICSLVAWASLQVFLLY